MLFQLIREELKGNQRRIIVSTVLSGMANSALLSITQLAALKPDHPSLVLFFMFVVCCALYALCLRHSVNALSRIIEAAIYKRRLSVASKIIRSELLTMERVGGSQIYQRLTQETTVLSQAAFPIASSLEAAVMVVFVAVYLFYLSQAAFWITLVLTVAGSAIFYVRDLRAIELMRQAAHTQVTLFDRLTDMLDGFKELRLNVQRGTELLSDYQQEARRLETKSVQTNVLSLENLIITNLNMYVLLAVLIFILPQYVPEYSSLLNKLIAIVLFVFGAIGFVLWGLPQFSRAGLAAEQLIELEQKLDQLAGPDSAERQDPWSGRFTQIHAEGIQFHYDEVPGQESFAIGPLSLSIRAGEIIFIVGGNGSGKSTLVKVLSALYAPTAGTLKVDGVPVTPDNAQAYREMISAITTDLHLFKKLYGLPNVSAERVQSLLEKMQIANKTAYTQEGFSAIDLSTGQRKRLAMVVALLEDRPILILDEWAADQDPVFRRYYYEELLPELKRSGKTVIAISHDDRYYHCADRVIAMEEGRLR